ncbi:hypothetical protein SASPL_100402 [Salvia splendens]|uniref:Pectin acetylesterase n=1 Tax=Salvia splendens TaxID=180675 RepID=A0A8X8YTV2_SALSN|nr:hypothetical protein SASPL_100402 [Salvia splendens]
MSEKASSLVWYQNMYGLANTLPTSCTSKFSPTLVKIAPHIQTPMFLIESAFDQYQLSSNVYPTNAKPPRWVNCTLDLQTFCNWTEIEIMRGEAILCIVAIDMATWKTHRVRHALRWLATYLLTKRYHKQWAIGTMIGADFRKWIWSTICPGTALLLSTKLLSGKNVARESHAESAVINEASNQPINWPNVTVDLKECYKVWGDDCKSRLHDAICNGRDDHRNICCYAIVTETLSGDCYYSIADDLRKNYPCNTPALALSLAYDNWLSCVS